MKLSEKIKKILWGYRLIFRIDGKYMFYISLKSAVSAVMPFVLIYFSSAIVDKISTGTSFGVVMRYVIVLLAAEMLLNGIKEIAGARSEIHQSQWQLKQEQFYCDINNRMPYADLEDPELQLLKNRIRSNQNATGAGLDTQITCYSFLLTAFISITISIFMTAGLFLNMAESGSQSADLVNSGAFTAAFIAFMLVCISISVWSSSVKFKKENEEWRTLPESNRLLHYIRSNLSNNLWAMDGRIYKWDSVVMDEIYKYTRDPKYIGNIYRIHRKYGTINMAAMGVMRFFLYMFVGIKVYYKAFSVGKFIQYVGAVEQLVSNATNMFIYFGILLNNVAYIEDIYTYCSHAETAAAKDGDVSEGTIRFSNVYYRYRTSDRDVLKNVDLELKEGRKYAIVGENGSGKTTFVKLLCGLYKPTSGIVSMNGTDVSTVSPTRYYDKFSVVFQDFSLVSASVGDNVACDMDQDRERVYSALDKAGFSERLSKMSKGTDTVIYREYDETGEEISGGEAQKIALARAVYKDSPYVILDEPTASLDPVSEEEIYSRVNEMNSDKTVFFVSHRLSSCKFCDEILVFDNGAIVQRGSHEKLLSEKGSKYFSLWNAQAQYYV